MLSLISALMVMNASLVVSAPKGHEEGAVHWLATSGGTPDSFSILRFTRGATAAESRVDTVYTSSTSVPEWYVWADRDTLVTLDRSEPPVMVRWFDAGVLVDEVQVPKSAWDKAERLSDLGLLLKPDGSAVVYGCDRWHQYAGVGGPTECQRYAAVRVTRGGRTTFSHSKREPRGTRGVGGMFAHVAGPESTLRSIAKPKGYTVRTAKVEIEGATYDGLECTSPSGTTRWPHAKTPKLAFELRPKSFVWVNADPPIYIAKGRAQSSMAPHTYEARHIFRACEVEPLDSYVRLGFGLWVHSEGEHHWKLWLGSHLLGTFSGYQDSVSMPR